MNNIIPKVSPDRRVASVGGFQINLLQELVSHQPPFSVFKYGTPV